ncbi:MAG: molybdenum cofactor guanylyltransferase [Chloroflexi bacterium]|nr:molybdenum cofactor guanylyltransferase [Chloroflexota bacterium]
MSLPAVDVIVLAGGKGRRLGRDKALVPVAGEPLLVRVLRRLEPLEGDRLIVVARGRPSFPFPLAENVRVVEDRVADVGALGGLYTGLLSAVHPVCVAVSVDLPFVHPGVLAFLAGRLDQSAISLGTDPDKEENPSAHGPSPYPLPEGEGFSRHWEAAVPVVKGIRQPLHAAYRRTCWERLEPWVTAAQHPPLVELLDGMSCRWVDDEELRQMDPELRSFFNLNLPADLRRAEELIATGVD